MLFSRRVAFAILVVISELLLIAMSVAWCVHQVLIAKYGEVVFNEENSTILYTEIVACALVVLLATAVLVLQFRRLKESRRGEDKEKGTQG